MKNFLKHFIFKIKTCYTLIQTQQKACQISPKLLLSEKLQKIYITHMDKINGFIRQPVDGKNINLQVHV